MQHQVVYVVASETNPNTSEIDQICRKMADEGYALRHVSPSQGEGGVTVGLWLFFSPGSDQVTNPTPGVRPEAPWSTWWRQFREERKGLGASLTLTGVMSVIIGVILHFALRHNIIETTLHLGYFFGIVGLFLFLIGLLIVF